MDEPIGRTCDGLNKYIWKRLGTTGGGLTQVSKKDSRFDDNKDLYSNPSTK